MSKGNHKKPNKKKKAPAKKTGAQNFTYSTNDVFSMMDETSRIIAEENSTRLSSLGPAASQSETLTNSIEFWSWMNRNYSKSEIFASPENMQAYLASTPGHQQFASKVVQGKGYEWDWMQDQRRAFSNLFKSYNAGDVANRPGSDITVYDFLSGTDTEQQLKAYTSKNKPHLKNTPKDMTVVVNAEKVDAVKEMGYEDVISFGDKDSIVAARDSRLGEMASGKATPSYTVKNVSATMGKAGMMGFVIGAGVETLISYKKWKAGKITKKQYLKEVLKGAGDAGATSTFTAGLMIPVSATITAAGASSIIVVPISFVISTTVNKVVAPAFARGEYLEILTDAKYYQSLIGNCEGLILAMDDASKQYEQFISNMTSQMRAFSALRGEVINEQALADFEYYASLPKQKAGIVIGSMVSLLQYTDDLEEELENQHVFKRIFKTVFGKNKVTKEEIHRNYERLVVYISEAISVLYERQTVDERITEILGGQILQLCSDNIVLEQRIRLVDAKVDSIKYFTDLMFEIDHGIYDGLHPIVAFCEIIPQVDSRLLHDMKELRILKAALSQRFILSGKPYTVEEFFDEIDKLSEDDKGVIYAGLAMRRSCPDARMILAYIENLYFIDDLQINRWTSLKEKIVNAYSEKQVITLNGLFTSLLDEELKELDSQIPTEPSLIGNEKKEEFETFEEAMRLFLNGKLIEALPLLQEAAEGNIPRALYYVALYYENGYGHIVGGDEKAKGYIEKGKELGEPLCTYKYGEYKYQDSVESVKRWRKDHIKSVERLVRQNDPAAICEYGWYYISTNQNNPNALEKATSYFEKAAALGYWPAAFVYYQLSETLKELRQKYGLTTEKIKDYSSLYENVEWYIIQTFLGRYYTLYDQSDSRYYKKAAQCFQKSLWLQEKGNPAAAYMAFLLSTGLVSDSLRDGISVNSEPMYYKAGLECDNPLSLFDLGLLYYHGVGEDQKGKDLSKALECLTASYGLMPKEYAAYMIGVMYFNGEGAKRDFDQAFKYLSEAARRGEKHALEVLSICYEEGLGTKKNIEKANELKKQAVEVADELDSEQIYLSYMMDMANRTE